MIELKKKGGENKMKEFDTVNLSFLTDNVTVP
jgi:hypothetical protein